MSTKKINLEDFAGDANDTTSSIRKVLFRDHELQLLYCVLNNEQPISLPELTRHYNKIFIKNCTKQWIDGKLKKIENFNLFEKKIFKDCNSHSKMDKQIVAKHNEWLVERNIDRNLTDFFGKTSYYFLTEEGEKWIEFISEQLKKKKAENGGVKGK